MLTSRDQLVLFLALLVALTFVLLILNRRNKGIQIDQNQPTEGFRDKRLLTVSEPSDKENAPLVMNNVVTYLINMRKNVDRLKRFSETFARTDMGHTRFVRIEGVDGRALDLRKYLTPQTLTDLLEAEQLGYRKHHYQLTRGAVGCYLAHMNAYKAISTQKADYALILEDDARILRPETLFRDIQAMVEQIPRDWDILLLGCVCFVCGKFSHYYDVNRYFLMHGYLIKKPSAEKILHILQDEPIEQQIDAKFSDLAERELLKIYCLRDKLAVQWDMGTNIQIPVKNIQGINPFHPLIAKDDDVEPN